jgi:hypothetical protein
VKNGISEEGFLPKTTAPKLWLIEWTNGNERYFNHYFSFQQQVALAVYLKWLPMLK